MPSALPTRPIDATLSVTKAARLLGTTERILSYKVRGYAIDPERFRG